MNEIEKRISDIGVVPVIKLNDPKRDAAPLAAALCEGGLPVAEVTFRAAGAATAIRLMRCSPPPRWMRRWRRAPSSSSAPGWTWSW